MNCKSCNTEITSKFCHECGHPATLHRIDGHYILHEIQHVLHFEKGILFTIRELITNPGQNIRFYLSENRSRLVKPIIFIILTSLIYSLANHFFHFEDGYVNYLDTQPSTTTKIFKWIQGHYGWSNIIMGIFIAFWTKLFFKKYDFNFFEILILLCFVMGIGMLIYSVFGIAQGITQMKLMQYAGLFGFSYSAWAIGQFFEKKKVISYIKAISAYLLGMLTFSLVAILIGTIIDYTK